MRAVSPYLIIFALLALIYHLGSWRPTHSSGEGFESMMDVSVGNWDEAVIHARKPVLVFFHDPDSAACNKVYPVIEDAHQTLRGQLKVARIELAKNASLAMRYQISGTPTLLLFKNGLLASTLKPEEFESFVTLESKLLTYCDEGE